MKWCPLHRSVLSLGVHYSGGGALFQIYCTIHLKTNYLRVWVLTNSIVVYKSLIAKWDWPLTRTALTLPHQEAAIDTTAQEVLGGIPRHWAMVPRELVQTVDRGDVVARHPADLPGFVAYLGPFSRLVVAQDSHLVTWKKSKRYL